MGGANIPTGLFCVDIYVDKCKTQTGMFIDKYSPERSLPRLINYNPQSVSTLSTLGGYLQMNAI
jgi:hypothetical protein